MPAAITYSAEPIPTTLFKAMLDSEWDTRTGIEIPEPTFYEAVSEEQRIHLKNEGDLVVIRADARGETERLRDSWKYKDTEYLITLELHTIESRQRLFDLFQEIRRIIHNNLHDEATTGFQICIYESFTEKTTEEQNYWNAEIRVRLSSVGETLDV